MNITNTAIREIKIVNPDVIHDSNGFLIENFDLETFEKALDRPVQLAEERRMHTGRHELMGLHYQLPPHAQEKLVHVTNGQTFQVAVDLRKSSPDFGKWIGTVVSDENRVHFWIPEGFAHGFVTLSDFADIVIGATSPFNEENERCIRWDDPALEIDWHGIVAPRVSLKDLEGKLLYEADVFI